MLSVLVPPSLQSDAAIPYPEGAKGDAEVVLTLIILPDGTVRSAEPIATNEPFSSLAARAALGWKFQPATRDGVAMVARIRFAVAFREPPPPAPEPPPGTEPAPPPPPPTGPARASAAPQEVRVVGNKPEPGRTATLTRAEVREIPGTFGDPFRAIEIMPGVTPIVSGLPFFFIRGAPPGDVGYFLDGIRVPLLFHVGIGPSVVHPALMDRVDLYPGGYPARFGRFSGGIVAGETAAPVRELHGEYNLRLFDAGALAETPFADGRGTLLLGGRYSATFLAGAAAPEEATDLAAGFGAADLRAGALTLAALSASFFSCALDGKASATPFLAALERFSVIGSALGAALATGLALSAMAGLEEPSFKRTGFSPHNSSRL